MARINWTDPALDDLAAHRRFIARSSAVSASRTIERILAAIDQLESFPSSGRELPELNRPDVRRLVVGRYLVIYALRRDEARIVMVHHASRRLDVDELLERLDDVT